MVQEEFQKYQLDLHLDAMPGKQMSIDADLNSGIIDEDASKRKKKKASTGSRFLWSYGWCI